MIGIVRAQPGPFADEHIELVRTFANEAAIANARLIDAVERQRTELSRFVSPQVAELVSSKDGEKLLAGHRAYVSVVFCDLRGFTAFAETAEPEELFEVLRQYHTMIGELIPSYDGTLEHFAGDGLMVFFNDPLPVLEHELQAIRMALAAQERFVELGSAWRKRGTELGHRHRGRLCGPRPDRLRGPLRLRRARPRHEPRLPAEHESGTQALISQRIYAAVEEAVEAEPVGELELKGFGRPAVAYEVRRLRS